MTKLIARDSEARQLKLAYSANGADFIAIYGRRRVGKTYLVRSLFSDRKNYFELVGLKDGSLCEQLQNFSRAFSNKFYPGVRLREPDSWTEAFDLLTKVIPKQEKMVIFFDELPWLATRKSGFLQSLDHVWNAQWSKLPNLLLIVCGSAASWMLEKLINAKGGLHNRLTKSILLHPFNLKETEEFLKSRSIKLNNSQVLDIYMAMGGVPHYLKQVEQGLCWRCGRDRRSPSET